MSARTSSTKRFGREYRGSVPPNLEDVYLKLTGKHLENSDTP